MLREFVDAIRKMASKYGARRIYVATDGLKIVEHLTKLLNEDEGRDSGNGSGGGSSGSASASVGRFTVLHNVIERNLSMLTPGVWHEENGNTREGEDQWAINRVARGEIDPGVMVRSALTDSQMLSECDALVLSDSGFSQDALLLAYGRRGVLPPFSVQGVWGDDGVAIANAQWKFIEGSAASTSESFPSRRKICGPVKQSFDLMAHKITCTDGSF
jgi:hypothetical protein